MNNFTKNLLLWTTIVLVVVLLFNIFQGGNKQSVSSELAYSDFVASVKAGNIREATISGESILASTTNGRVITTFAPQGANIVNLLEDNNVRIIELGIQSTSNKVLHAVGRPCEIETVRKAANAIKENGLGLPNPFSFLI